MRGQSHVVGFVLILGFGIVALGTLTVGVGTVIDAQSSNADGERVAGDLTDAMQVTERTGVHTNRVSFAEGTLTTTERTLRVLEDGTEEANIERELAVDGLRFESGDRQVVSVAGAVIHGTSTSAWLDGEPPITSSEANEVLVVGAPVLGTSHQSVGGQGGVTATLRTNVTHERIPLDRGNFSVAIETAEPGPLERYFERQNATVNRNQYSGDDHESVVATFPGERTGYLVVHDLDMEVNNG